MRANKREGQTEQPQMNADKVVMSEAGSWVHGEIFIVRQRPGSCHAAARRLPGVRRAATSGACLACEAVVSKAKDRADSPLCRALGREEAQVLT
jgi:hypothetical protein